MTNRKFPLDVYDFLILGGVVAVEYGIAQWSLPAAWVFGGALLIMAGVWPDVRRKGAH